MFWKNILVAGLGGVVTAAILYFGSVITKVPTILVPSGAVLAFNKARCPDGWVEYRDAQGRVVVGIGEQPGLSRRTLGEIGGSEKYYLTKSEIPIHNVDVRLEYYDNENNRRYKTENGNRADKVRIIKTEAYEESAQRAHDNMPPFVALCYCEKL